MKRRPWYQEFQIIAWVVGGLGALGTAAVVASRYISLPSTVEAAVQKNQEQDKILDRVTAVLEYQKQQVQNQQRPPDIQRFWDAQEQRYYCDDGQQQWWTNAEGRCE